MKKKDKVSMKRLITNTAVKVDETAKGTLEKTKEAGKKTVIAFRNGTADLSDKVKEANYQNRIKKFNPIFPEMFFNEDFHVPNIIKIVDDAERRGIDVCNGAIGWLGRKSNTEILYLYDEFVELCGLSFAPMPQCDVVYCIDSFDRKRFIRADQFGSIAHEEQVAELRHIAQMLGAKRCEIEIRESEKNHAKTKKSIGVAEQKQLSVSVNEKCETNYQSNSDNRHEGKIITEFEGATEPKMPVLKHFKYNSFIKGLIETRLSGRNLSKNENYSFADTSMSAISQEAAYAIDSIIGGVGGKGNSSMKKQIEQQRNKIINFYIEF